MRGQAQPVVYSCFSWPAETDGQTAWPWLSGKGVPNGRSDASYWTAYLYMNRR